MRWDSSWKRVVLVPMDRIGDAVSDTPAISFLASRGVEVVVLATAYTAQIFQNNPHVLACVNFSRRSRDGLITSTLHNRATVKELQRLRPQAVVGMMREIRELAGIYKGLSLPVLQKPQDNNLSIGMRWVEFFRALGFDARPQANEIYPDRQDRLRVEEWAGRSGIDLTKPLVVVHPGCAVYKEEKDVAQSLRCWPLDNYFKVFDDLPADAQIALTGIHPAEGEANAYIVKGSPRRAAVFDLANIRALADLIARSRLVITLDTGTLHIAAATKTPVIGLFGPSDPGKYGPCRDGVTYVRVDEDLACWPCDQNATCGGDNVCMKGLRPEAVSSAVRKALG